MEVPDTLDQIWEDHLAEVNRVVENLLEETVNELIADMASASGDIAGNERDNPSQDMESALGDIFRDEGDNPSQENPGTEDIDHSSSVIKMESISSADLVGTEDINPSSSVIKTEPISPGSPIGEKEKGQQHVSDMHSGDTDILEPEESDPEQFLRRRLEAAEAKRLDAILDELKVLRQMKKDARERITCSVCYLLPQSLPVLHCDNGHIVCNFCINRLPNDKCPEDNQTTYFAARSLVAETYIRTMSHECRWLCETNAGPKMNFDQLQEHIKTCESYGIKCFICRVDFSRRVVKTHFDMHVVREPELVMEPGWEYPMYALPHLRPPGMIISQGPLPRAAAPGEVIPPQPHPRYGFNEGAEVVVDQRPHAFPLEFAKRLYNEPRALRAIVGKETTLVLLTRRLPGEDLDYAFFWVVALGKFPDQPKAHLTFFMPFPHRANSYDVIVEPVDIMRDSDTMAEYKKHGVTVAICPTGGQCHYMNDPAPPKHWCAHTDRLHVKFHHMPGTGIRLRHPHERQGPAGEGQHFPRVRH